MVLGTGLWMFNKHSATKLSHLLFVMKVVRMVILDTN